MPWLEGIIKTYKSCGSQVPAVVFMVFSLAIVRQCEMKIPTKNLVGVLSVRSTNVFNYQLRIKPDKLTNRRTHTPSAQIEQKLLNLMLTMNTYVPRLI